MTSDVDTLVVGGGIGGMATALSLARFGHVVRLVEQAPQFSEIGAGLQIGPNATRALDKLGLLDALNAVAVHPRRAVVRDAITAEVLTTLDFGEPFVARYGYPYVVAHRSDLLELLLQACRSEPHLTLENDRTVTTVDEHEEHAAVTFADGQICTATVVIGADGIKSRVRRLLDTSEPTFSGHIAHRGTIGVDQVRTEVSAHDVVLWIGPGIHLMQYPVRRGELYNQVAVYESCRYAAGEHSWGTSEEFEAMFARACAEVRDAVSQIDASRTWPIFDREPLPGWSTPHTVLIGDAAHPMLQYLGQGACQALEDALTLAHTLAEYPAEPARAFEAYESARLELASKCQTVARPWGQTWHTTDDAMLALRNRVFRMRDPADYTDLDWLYAERPDAPPAPPRTADQIPNGALQ
jgi:2-polyprenyl-6-methoxyphenol hydroxylase-like FAD-dependent oxidoreductase